MIIRQTLTLDFKKSIHAMYVCMYVAKVSLKKKVGGAAAAATMGLVKGTPPRDRTHKQPEMGAALASS